MSNPRSWIDGDGDSFTSVITTAQASPTQFKELDLNLEVGAHPPLQCPSPRRLTGPSPSPRSPSPSPSPPRQRRLSMQMLEKQLRSSFSDDMAAALVSAALDVPGSGVNPRRKPKPARMARKAGVWNSVADLIRSVPSRTTKADARWADFSGRKRSDSPAPQLGPPSTAPWARKSYSDPSGLVYNVARPEDRFGPHGDQPRRRRPPPAS